MSYDINKFTRRCTFLCNRTALAGLPENITEAIIQEIFERCGEITTLRLSKKNFCHIRFVLEASVDAAIYLSGYRVRIGSSGEPANTGRLHVDFAQVCYFLEIVYLKNTINVR